MITQHKNIDSYIRSFPADIKKRLEEVRKTIRAAAPKAQEKIGYGIPTFTINGKNLVHFGGFKSHIGFYPAPSGITAFKKELSQYEGAKGSIKFPLDKPLPLTLIKKIVEYRMKEVLAQSKKK